MCLCGGLPGQLLCLLMLAHAQGKRLQLRLLTFTKSCDLASDGRFFLFHVRSGRVCFFLFRSLLLVILAVCN